MFQIFQSILRDGKGIAALEYALLAGLVFAAVIGAAAMFGPALSSSFANLGQSVLARDGGT